MERPTIPIANKRILVVEDNPQVRETIARVLEVEGFDVFQARDGAKALELIDRLPPHLILSDIQMPELDGMELYQTLRKDPRYVAIPFIFLTSQDSPDDILAGRQLGVEDYLTKPIDSEELVKIINARLLRSAEIKVAIIDQAYLDTVKVLANTIEGRDPYTHGHVERVATYARWLAEALQWPAENLRNLEYGARLHDIGKIIIPDHILNKAGALSGEEWALMRKHPEAGARILRDIHYMAPVISYVLHHHERWDGSGYPHGLVGREIPMEGRLMALADVYDALTTNRSYHPARPQSEVIRFLELRSGKHFDPELTRIFIQVLQERERRIPERERVPVLRH